MGKFNEEIFNFDLNDSDDKRLAYIISLGLQFSLTKEELNKLKQDWKNVCKFKTISLWEYILKSVDISYNKEEINKEKLLDYLEEKRKIGIAMNRTSLFPCEGFQPAILIDEIEDFIKKN